MLTTNDAPPEVLPFIDAVCIGDPIGMDTARQLLMTYMRVRYVPNTSGRLPDQQVDAEEVGDAGVVDDVSEDEE